ncbi:MAG: hypothetical protein ACOX52_21495 [Verrucomicrobiota bacterium]
MKIASRHRELSVGEAVVHPGMKDLFCLARDEGVDLHPTLLTGGESGARDCTTDEGICATCGDGGHFAYSIFSGQVQHLPVASRIVLSIDDEGAAGHVEDGRYSMVPDGQCDFHVLGAVGKICQSLVGTLRKTMPRRSTGWRRKGSILCAK